MRMVWLPLVIFFMESVLRSNPKVWKRFGLTTQDEADVIRPMAYNQGFYNAFLALFATLSMLLASIVLLTSSPKLLRAALIQGAAPLLGIIFLVAAMALAPSAG